MSLVSDLKETMEDFLDSKLTGVEVVPYSVDLNESKFTGDCYARFDREGDLLITLEISDQLLCQYISPEVMKDWLEAKGYLE